MPPLAQLDHVIILLSAQDFHNLPSWLTDNFTIIEGGTHSQGTSQNKLVIFQDGTYLELFSWVSPQPEGVKPYADFPGWAKKPEGHIIDWALTGPDAHEKYNAIMQQLRSLEEKDVHMGVTYDEPKEGGRRRKDGKELRWVTTRPRRTGSTQTDVRTNVPFFCHDVSDRALRVPYTNESSDSWPDIITHPCGASGVAGIILEVPQSELKSYAKLYQGILGTDRDTNAMGKQGTSFTVSTPEGFQAGPDRCPQCNIQLQADKEGGTESSGSTSTGIQALLIRTCKADHKGKRLDADGFGTSIRLC